MNREIKFRAWDSLLSKRCMAYMLSDLNFRDPDGQVYSLAQAMREQDNHPDTFHLMQYTGLKDKNGVEIYEGDIFEFTEAKKRRRGQVIFEDAMFKMKDANGWGAMTLQNQYDMEVIGNIYQNSELLTPTKEQGGQL